MTSFAFASVKASPGVTTLCQALALCWPEDRAVIVVEADPAGGDLAARLDLPAEPGLVSLAAAGRRGLSPAVVLEQVQVASGWAGLLVGPPSARQAVAALDLLGAGWPDGQHDEGDPGAEDARPPRHASAGVTAE